MATNFPVGLDTFINPDSTTNLAGRGVPGLSHAAQHVNTNDSLKALQEKTGVNFSSQTNSIDYIINLFLATQTEHPNGVVRTITGIPFPTNVIWFANLGKTVKLVEKIYTYNSSRNVIKIELILYNGTSGNVILRTITDTKTLNGPFEIERIRSVT